MKRTFAPSTTSPNTSSSRVFNDLSFPAGSNVCTAATIVCSDTDPAVLQAASNTVQLNPIALLSPEEHNRDFRAAAISWTSPLPNRYFQANYFSGGTFNASGYDFLEFRVSRRRRDTSTSSPTTMNDVLLPHDLNTTDTTGFLVQLVMDDGSISRSVALNKYSSLNGPVGKPHGTAFIDGSLHPILRTVRIPVDEFGATNLTQIKGVRIIFSSTSRGAIFLSNIRFSD